HIAANGSISRSIPPDPAAGAAVVAAVAVSPGGNLVVIPAVFGSFGNPVVTTVETHSSSEFTPVSVPNVAPVASGDSYSLHPDTNINVVRPGILANDTDANGDALRAILVAGPTHGTLTLNPNGSFTYVPSAGYQGNDNFTY